MVAGLRLAWLASSPTSIWSLASNARSRHPKLAALSSGYYVTVKKLVCERLLEFSLAGRPGVCWQTPRSSAVTDATSANTDQRRAEIAPWVGCPVAVV